MRQSVPIITLIASKVLPKNTEQRSLWVVYAWFMFVTSSRTLSRLCRAHCMKLIRKKSKCHQNLLICVCLASSHAGQVCLFHPAVLRFCLKLLVYFLLQPLPEKLIQELLNHHEKVNQTFHLMQFLFLFSINPIPSRTLVMS